MTKLLTLVAFTLVSFSPAFADQGSYNEVKKETEKLQTIETDRFKKKVKATEKEAPAMDPNQLTPGSEKTPKSK